LLLATCPFAPGLYRTEAPIYWRKIILFTFTVLVPAIFVGVSNFAVFPDSSLPATLMLIVTVGIAGVFTYFSGDATAKVRRYCVSAVRFRPWPSTFSATYKLYFSA